jgi:hypothetical protein
MKLYRDKKIALILALMLIVPIFWNQNAAQVYAATTPTFVQSKVDIVGEGKTYQLEIKNKVKGSKYKWSSSDTGVAKVTTKGLVTSVNKGSVNIKCKITYPSKKTKTLSCKVTVTVPATDITISNAKEVNGTHFMTLGETFNFDEVLTPAKASDKVIWSVGNGDAACIRIDNTTEGIVTATKAGKVILKVTATKSASQEDINNSIINDDVIIEVVGPSATVRSAEITGSTEIKVVFDSPVDQNTVIGLNNKLSDNIELSLRPDTKGVLANDPGALTASLSSDMQTLTITSTNRFNGIYGINFTSKILTTGGVAMEQYYKQITYLDTTGPAIAGVELDDTGMIATIRFTEAVDFTNFKVSNAAPVSGTAESSTLSTISNKQNYIVSTDKKSVTINLSKISAFDYGKVFSVVFSGIKDLSGNIPASYTLTAILRTDATLKSQAQLISIIRSSYNTLTATFSRSIQDSGMLTVANGASVDGVVDSTNAKKVNYKLSEADALLTGAQTVSIGFWNSYNVNPSDTTSQQMISRTVNFNVDKSNPVLLSYEFDAATSVLTLTYNKDIDISATTGIFSSTLDTITDDIISGTNIAYTNVIVTDNDKVIKLKMGNMTLLGKYTFTLDQGFVTDSFKNQNLPRTISITNANEKSTELPGPYSITQSATNPSEIYLEFANKLDVPSAQTISNYSIPGVSVISAQVVKNTSDGGATVLLTVAEGSINVTVERPITITGLKGYNGNYTAMASFATTVQLRDNKKPTYVAPPVFDKTTKDRIQLNFSEQIEGTLVVRVTQLNTGYVIDNTVTVSGNSAYIKLGFVPATGTYVKIEILTNNITDLSGNASTAMPSSIGVVLTY